VTDPANCRFGVGESGNEVDEKWWPPALVPGRSAVRDVAGRMLLAAKGLRLQTANGSIEGESKIPIASSQNSIGTARDLKRPWPQAKESVARR